ncbi:MAG: hypothetical protein V4438_04395 [Patescibacteria group bacterium]
MSDDLYKPYIPSLDQIFRKHNHWMDLYADRDHILAITFERAKELVDQNIWETEKKKYYVMLPKIWPKK